MDYNVVVYAMRKGYEIKTWITVNGNETNEELEELAYKKFKEVGAPVFYGNESLDFEM